MMMTTKMTSQKEPQTRYTRSVNLDPNIAERLQRVCDHLGVTVNSYLKLKIGEVVSRDEISLLAKDAQSNAATQLERFFQYAVSQVSEPAEEQLELGVDVEESKTQGKRSEH